MIEYPSFFFRLVRPIDVANRLNLALNDPETIAAVGVEDPKMLVEHIRDHHPDPELKEAARKLFPYPGDSVTAGFNFGPSVVTTRRIALAIPHGDGFIEVLIPASPVELDPNSGAVAWVTCYREMVADWCAAQREERLAAQ
ncbi:hypothetical protein MD484_g3030, partial [Candolleomyces efflorescens]